MITRENYMANSADLHVEYFAQFGGNGLADKIVAAIGKEKLLASKDKYFNDISLQLWNKNLFLVDLYVNKKMLKDAKEIFSTSTAVCIMKALARKWVISQGV